MTGVIWVEYASICATHTSDMYGLYVLDPSAVFMAWIHPHKLWYVVIYPCPNFNGTIANRRLNLSMGEYAHLADDYGCVYLLSHRRYIFKSTKNWHRQTFFCGNLYSEITDHLPNFIVWPCEKLFKLQRPLIRIYSEKNIKKFTAALSSESWDFLTNTTLSVADIYQLFSETFLRLFHSCFPLTKQSRKISKDKRWITPGLKISIKHKDRLYRKKLNNPTDSNILK